MALHVHRAERADGLVEALRALLSEPLPDPFASEVVAVPTRGMERWLSQRLSACLGASPGRGDGVCANVAFPFPREIVTDAVALATGIDPEQDRWRPERMVWPLLDIVDAAVREERFATLEQHLRGELRQGRRFGLVRHLAGLFDRYALHRPEMVAGWSAGRDDGWQAELWRRLRIAIAQPDPAERLIEACARLRAEPGIVDLPQRFGLFGLTRLPAGRLAVLRALSEHRDVHVFVLHPSPALWETVRGHAASRRAEDPTATLPRNRLLASWGTDVRELQLVLGHDGAEHHHPVEHAGGTLLARVQEDVRHDRRPPGVPLPGAPDERPALGDDDRSIEIHACHGRARQVEVVRDAILHLLQDDRTLEPRDVIVMCPDIEAFAPLIHATFGAGEALEDGEYGAQLAPELQPPDLRVRLADRALRQTNPVLGVVAQLLELADQRMTASQLLDLADREPVRRRFRFDDDDITRIEDWVHESGVRWGLDAQHRAPFKLDVVEHGTWRFGLDRLLVGVTMTEDDERLFGEVLPVDDVGSGDIDLVGRLAEYVERLSAAVRSLRGPQPIAAWAAALANAADALTGTPQREAWRRTELQRLLDDVVGEADGHATRLHLSEIRALLADRLAGRPTRANFRTGHLTFCTLVPMRSVPHRVVVLLGLDDGAFPRRAARDGDDLMASDPQIGERDPRTEDRQMLLDALLAARDRLLITYTGNDERTNEPRPPAVPVGELLDVVDRTVRVPEGEARSVVVRRHPLQPFDPRNFSGERPWSFDHTTLRGARALLAPRTERGAFLRDPLPPLEEPLVELEDLVKFVERPVRHFLRRRLGISVADYSQELDDALPVELDGLERWGVGQRLLDACLRGSPLQVAIDAERARGKLPPGRIGERELEKIRPTVEQIVAGAAKLLPGEPSSVDVRVRLADGRILSGTVPGVRGSAMGTVTYSRVSARHRIAAWVRFLALNAAYPEREYEAVTVGRLRSGGHHHSSVTVSRVPPLEAGLAREQLERIVDLFDRGMCEPLPLYCMTSAAHAAGRSPAKEWESGYKFPKEDAEPDHQLVLGGTATFEELLREVPRADETWCPEEPSRFGRYARRLWEGLLACESLDDR